MRRDQIEKRIVTPEDILTALRQDTWGGGGAWTRPRLEVLIVSSVWGVPEVYDPRTAAWHIKGPEFSRLLAEMVGDGRLAMMDGWTLENLDPKRNYTRNWNFYLLPEKARELEAAREHRVAKAHQEAAEEYARGVLAERHPEEFAKLVEEFLARRAEEE